MIHPRPLASFFLSACVAFSGSIVSAQDTGSEPEVIKYRPSRGYVELNSVRYPVLIGILEVEATGFGGIRFSIEKKRHKDALLMAEKIKRFYLGKKIGKIVLPQFKKASKPETTAWSSMQCGKENEGALAVVKVEENTVTVYLVPSCDEGVLAHFL